MSSFKERYSIPANVRDGVEIQLEEVTFTVALPTESNRVYKRGLASLLSNEAIVDGGVDTSRVSIAMMIDLQQRLFLDMCILNVSGWPDGEFDPRVFYDEYPMAFDELYAKAVELANAEDERILAEAKKPSSTLNGSEDGTTQNSTQSLSEPGELKTKISAPISQVADG